MIAAIDATALYTALLTMLGLVLSTLGVAIVNLRGSRRRGKEAADDREKIKGQLAAENGYDSLGEGIASIETKLNSMDSRLQEGDGRFGRIEELLKVRGTRIDKIEQTTTETLALAAEARTQLRSHLEDVEPLLKRALPLMEVVEQMQRKKKPRGGA